jgi:hypothetical protein
VQQLLTTFIVEDELPVILG